MTHRRPPLLAAALFAASLAIPAAAQLLEEDSADGEIFELSPFEVSTTGDIGYYASQTLSGGRINSRIEDLGTSVQVVSEELMQDIGATKAEDVLLYTANTDVGGPSGNISAPSSDSSGTPDDTPLRTNPAGNNRIRAIGSADLTRDFFRTDIPFDRYNAGRLDILRGANSFLFGLGSPSGILNYNLSKADFSDSGEVSAWFTNEDLEENFSRRFDISVNRVLVDRMLAVRVAAVMDRQEYVQELARRDTDRYYGALSYKPLKNRNITFRVNGETGKLRSTPPSALGPLEALSSWLENKNAVNVGGAVNRYVNDPYTNVAVRNVPYQGTDAGGKVLDFEEGGSFVAARKWSLIFDGSEDASGLPSRAVQNGIDSNMWVTGDPLLDPDANFTSNLKSLFFMGYPNLHEIGGAYAGWLPQGLTDYSVFDFRNQLLTGGFDRVNFDYDTYNVKMEATTKDQDFGIEIAYNFERVGQDNTIPMPNPTLYMDINRTHVMGPNSLFGDDNPNFGRVFIVGASASRNVTETERETIRATAYGKYDFDGKFDGGFLSKLGRHTGTLLLDSDTQTQRQTQQRLFAFGNDAAWHLAQPNATQFQRQVNYTVYLSPAYPQAFTDPNFKATDFQITPRTDVNFDLPSGFAVPVAYYDLGEPYWKPDPVVWDPGVMSRGSAQVADFNPAYGNADGNLSEEKVDSAAFNTQSFFLRDHLVVNLGWRRDKWKSSRANAPISADPAAEGQRDFSPSLFNLDAAEANSISDNNFSYNFVLNAPRAWLPDSLGFSVHYGESSNFIPATSAYDIDGTPVPSGSGENRDYGFTIRAFESKLIARFNWYETTVVNEPFEDISFPFAWTATSHLTRQYNNMLSELWRVDRDGDGKYASGDANGNGILDSRDATGQKYLSLPELRQAFAVYESLMYPYLREVNDVQFDETTGTASQGNGAYFTLADTADVKARGLEIEAVYNPTRQFRLGLAVVKQQASRTNLAPRFGDMFNKLVAVQEQVPAIKGANLGANKLGTPLREAIQATNLMWGQLINVQYTGQAYYKNTALEGADNPEVREWRVSLYGNYSFTEGRLRGANIGAAYRFVDNAAIGYGLKTIGDLIIPDVDTVHYDRAEHTFDVWAGYSFRISKGVNWRIQFNIRNLFAGGDPLAVQAQPDGSVARVRYAPPRTFLLQNTITF